MATKNKRPVSKSVSVTMGDLTKLGNDMARAFRRSLPPRLRPGAKANFRYEMALIRRMFKPRPFPAGMGSVIYGVRRG
jgi:hypothetical protein